MQRARAGFARRTGPPSNKSTVTRVRRRVIFTNKTQSGAYYYVDAFSASAWRPTRANYTLSVATTSTAKK